MPAAAGSEQEPATEAGEIANFSNLAKYYALRRARRIRQTANGKLQSARMTVEGSGTTAMLNTGPGTADPAPNTGITQFGETPTGVLPESTRP